MTTIKDVFDEIAPSWYNHRHWTIFRRELEALARRWKEGRLLNIGCAHGPDFLPFTRHFELHGVDISPEMLRMARQYARKFAFSVALGEADARRLPYPDDSFDWALAVATYHHIEGKEERLKALRELRRVLKPGGEAFITVWNRGQPRFWFSRREVTVPYHVRGKALQRYYYLFSFHELEVLVKEAGLTVLRSFPEARYHFPIKFFSRNICLLVRKGG